MVNAGLPHPRVLRNSSGVVDELPLEGMPLGLFAESFEGAHDIAAVTLEPGDTLLLATDGLAEARDSENRFFEDARLESLLSKLSAKPPQEILTELASAAAGFTGKRGLVDDLTMIALART